jgi:hypothetical protein
MPFAPFLVRGAMEMNNDASVRIGQFAGGAYPASSSGGQFAVAIGNAALQSQSTTTATYNTAVGITAMYTLTTGTNNTAFGYSALLSNSTGTYNTAIGASSLYNSVSGASLNTAVGGLAGASLTSGAQNTIIGYQAAAFTVPLATGTNNTVIGFQARTAAQTSVNTITLGNPSIATLRCQVTTITALSDIRDKKNVLDSPYGLEFINRLRPVTFIWDMRDEDGKHGDPDMGFIAQDLMALEDELDAHDVLSLTYRDNPERIEATPGRLIPILVKAVQELSAKVEQQEQQILLLQSST